MMQGSFHEEACTLPAGQYLTSDLSKERVDLGPGKRDHTTGSASRTRCRFTARHSTIVCPWAKACKGAAEARQA